MTKLRCCGSAWQVDEPAYTRRRVREFLRQHTCYELIPESGKVVLIDLDLPVRQVISQVLLCAPQSISCTVHVQCNRLHDAISH